MDIKKMYDEAMKAKETAYAPFSKFRVGAALLTKSGKIYRGCNIENSSYPATICAERTAFVKAISEGEREFESIMILCDDGEAMPCGICRQFMREFCEDDFIIMTGNGYDEIQKYTMEEILPKGFKLETE